MLTLGRTSCATGSNIKCDPFEFRLTANGLNYYNRYLVGRGLSFFLVVVALLLSEQPLESQEFPFFGRDAYQILLRAGYSHFERFAALLVPSKIPLLADGGGDGGGDGGSGDGGSGDGGTGTGDGTGSGTGSGDGTGDGTGDSASNGAADAAAATSDAAASTAAAATSDDAASATAAATSDDAASAAAAATSDDAASAAATDPSEVAPPTENNANTVTTDPTAPPAIAVAPTTDQNDPNAITVTPELDAIMSIPTTDPRGGEVVSPPVNNGIPGGAAPALGGSGAAPVDIAINAVIVSAAQSPWDAIRKAPGVRNVIVTGGIIALGKTPIPGEIPGGGPQPAWLRLIPDLRLLNGSAIPPVVPNVIDVRIMNCPITIENLNP